MFWFMFDPCDRQVLNAKLLQFLQGGLRWLGYQLVKWKETPIGFEMTCHKVVFVAWLTLITPDCREMAGSRHSEDGGLSAVPRKTIDCASSAHPQRNYKPSL